ncbi:hypothetical protein [Paracoccus spongiarum]|uniref:Uncharacterized protein n=1 Tax=Paracoccus spongiarum TaxID=3064387 RepID=A0ABT9JCF3_9RHOB|nr:hypothetical protein [Paracoccus sp. 2205BS29-5]MDP5307400.1 hypothetical protein [Paracoccus sp. 2205BS29-5]
MRRAVTIALFLAALPAASPAQEWTQFAYYLARIGPEDLRSSSGQPIRSLGGALQQDRANYHRFGIRHANDESDPVFANRDLRARIPAMVAAGGNDRGRLARMAREGRPFDVGVFVCGSGNTPSVIYIAGRGEDHSGCN